MKKRHYMKRFAIILSAALGLVAFSAPPVATISLDAGTTYQTITTGWMAAAQTGELKETIPRGEAPLWASYSDGLLNDAVNTLGLTCISMGVRSGQESSTDRWAQYMAGTGPNVDFDVINDNSSPTSANASGFHWGFTDFRAARTIAKFRAAMIASGQTPCVKAGYVDFEASTTTGFKHSTDTAEYGEFFLQFFNHMQATFGWVPTELDIVTEPTNGSNWWTPTALGNAIVSVNARLAAAGYHPRIIAPSYVGIDAFYVTNISTILGLTGVNAALDEVGYHLYSGNTNTQRAAVLSAASGKCPNMTELIGGDQTTIMADLTVANACGWMANSLAYPDASDDGGNYYTLNGTTGAYALASRARYLRHFFHYIRPGAVRIAAASAQGALTPVAFVNTGGRSVVVVNATSAQAFTVGPLPAGTYGIRYTTATATHVNAGDQTIGAGGTITTSIPGAGTITIFDTGTGTPAPPGAFGKSSPANGATGQSTSLTLSWGASTGATAYAYCYDTTNDGACSAWTSTSTSTSAAISGLAANTTYYWQARATNASGTTYADGASTAFRSFTTIGTAPGAFAKSSPASGATGQATSLTLSWGASTGATNYEYCYDTTNDGSCGAWTSSGASTSAGISGLTNNTTYYWQVRATNATGTTYANGGSTVFWSLATAVAAPGAFAKTSPAAGATGQATSLTLSWGASTGATSYEYCYDTTNDGACAAWVSTGSSTSAGISGLTANTTYYWQARATNVGGIAYADGSATLFRSFTTQGPDVVQNGAFSSGLTGWQTFGAPDASYLVTNVTGGVLQFYRNAPPPGIGGQGVVLQPTGAAMAANAPISASFDLGNSSTVRKRMSVLIHDQDFSDLSVCTFWLPANAPLRTYRMVTHTSEAWTGATISFYAATAGSDGGFYRLDNVSLAYAPAESADQTSCVDPTTPAAPGGAAGAELLQNGGFGLLSLTSWSLFGTLTQQLFGGVLEVISPPGGTTGGLLQTTGQPMTSGQIMTATFDLGNSSSVRKRVTVLVHDLDFSDLSVCSFWLAPGQPLSPYAIQTFATRAWTNATLSIYPSTTGLEPWTRLDNFSLKRTPGAAITGTTCLEPGSAPAAAPQGGDAPPPDSSSGVPAGAIVANWVPTGGFTQASGGTTVDAWSGWEATAGVTQTSILQPAQPFDLRGVGAARLTFQSWLSASQSSARVQISTDGVNWQTLLDVPAAAAWTTVDVNLAAFAGQIVYVRFVFDGALPGDQAQSIDVWRIAGVLVEGWAPTPLRR